MKKITLLKWLWIWPPFLGAGIKVKSVSADLMSLVVEMKLRFWNKNYFHTQFGGSLFSMTDPFYALLLLEHLGKDYIIWDKAASIKFISPGRGNVYAKFELTKEIIERIRHQAALDKVEPQFTVLIYNDASEVVAEVIRTLHIKRKNKST